MHQGNVTEGTQNGALLFDPRLYLSFWPTTNFSEYKSAFVGRHSRALSVTAYDVATGHGFSFLAVPNTRRGIETNPYSKVHSISSRGLGFPNRVGTLI